MVKDGYLVYNLKEPSSCLRLGLAIEIFFPLHYPALYDNIFIVTTASARRPGSS